MGFALWKMSFAERGGTKQSHASECWKHGDETPIRLRVYEGAVRVKSVVRRVSFGWEPLP